MSVTYDDMMDAQDAILHGLESREYQYLPKVLELCLKQLEEKASKISDKSIGHLFLQACGDYERQVKKY